MSFAALVLAAGHARRFGEDKLVQDFQGAPLVSHAIKAARAAPVERIVIVKRLGAALDAACRAAIEGDVRAMLVEIDSMALSDSLRAGLQTAGSCAGYFVFLGDMPLTPTAIPDLLAQRLGDHFAALPMFKDKPGHPVLLSARAAALANEITGDQGAGVLLKAHADETLRIKTDAAGVIADVDTYADLARLGVSEADPT